MEAFAQRWEAVQQRIAHAAGRAGRSPTDIHVVAVTKTRTREEVQAALAAGMSCLGENRVQEAEAKKPEIRGAAEWHLIGHLQGNKAGKAAALFDVVQSVDSARLAQALSRRAGELDRRLDILLQVNTSGATEQSGAPPEQLEALAGQVAELPHLRLQGLMTIGLFSQDEAVVRSCFVRLRHLREQLLACSGHGLDLRYLSMGMSGDFEWAIAEGANMLRLGTVLFGPRSKQN
jgi:PLP dependent protein